MRAIWKCLLFHRELFRVLFIHSCVAIFEIWKGVIKQKVSYGQVAETLPARPLMLAVPLGHWYWLPQEAGLLVYSQRATLGFEAESWVDAPYLSGLKIFLGLCYILKPLRRPVNSSLLWS